MYDDADTTRFSATETQADTVPMETFEGTDTTSRPTSSLVDVASFSLPDSTYDPTPNIKKYQRTTCKKLQERMFKLWDDCFLLFLREAEPVFHED